MIRGNRPRLSDLELAVVVCLVQGMKPKQAMGALDISQSHYTKLRNRVLDKMGVSNDAQIGVMAERYQLINLGVQNVIEDRREERLDALRSAP